MKQGKIRLICHNRLIKGTSLPNFNQLHIIAIPTSTGSFYSSF